MSKLPEGAHHSFDLGRCLQQNGRRRYPICAWQTHSAVGDAPARNEAEINDDADDDGGTGRLTQRLEGVGVRK